jgi:hypothetical protein
MVQKLRILKNSTNYNSTALKLLWNYVHLQEGKLFQKVPEESELAIGDMYIVIDNDITA